MSFTVFFFFFFKAFAASVLDLFEGHLLHIKLGVGACCGKGTFVRCTCWEKTQTQCMLLAALVGTTFLSGPPAPERALDLGCPCWLFLKLVLVLSRGRDHPSEPALVSLRSFEMCKYVVRLTSGGLLMMPRGLQGKMGHPGAQGDVSHRNDTGGPSGECMSWQEVTTGW